jgi:TRAP-type transport system periplasmic protein
MSKFAFRKLALLLLIPFVLLAVSCGQEEAAEAPAEQPEDVEGMEETGYGPEVPGMIDMSMPDQTISLRLSYDDPVLWPEQANVPDPEHAFALLFKDYVESQTGGAVEIELFGAGSLGTYRQTLEMVQNGSLDINIGTGSLGSFYAPFQIFTIPYLFSSDDVATAFFEESEFWADLMDDMEEETGMKYLAMGQNGWRNFTNNVREIRAPEDLNGIKFRVMQSPVYVRMIESMGGSAVPIAWNELYTALQTGVVDGEENPISSIALGKLYEVQEYLTMDGHVWSENVMVMNSDRYNSLPVGVQQIIMQGAMLGARANNVAERMVSNIVKFEVVAEQMQVYFPTAAEKAKFREVAQPAVIEYLEGELGEEMVNGFLQAVAETEASTGWRR